MLALFVARVGDSGFRPAISVWLIESFLCKAGRLGPRSHCRRCGSDTGDDSSHTGLMGRKEFIAAGAALCSQTGATLDFAGLLVELANSHLFLDPASLDKLAEAAN